MIRKGNDGKWYVVGWGAEAGPFECYRDAYANQQMKISLWGETE